MQRLIITPAPGLDIAALSLRVLDEIHIRLRQHYIDFTRTASTMLGLPGETHVFTLDPVTAGTLTITGSGSDGAHGVAFEVEGMAELSMADPLRNLAGRLRLDPRIRVSLTRTKLSAETTAEPATRRSSARRPRRPQTLSV